MTLQQIRYVTMEKDTGSDGNAGIGILCRPWERSAGKKLAEWRLTGSKCSGIYNRELGTWIW